MNSSRVRFIGPLLLALLASTASLSAQALDMDHFEGYESWPLFTPGDLEFPGTDEVGDLRIGYEALFGGGPVPAIMNLWMDVLDVSFRGREAQWIQWTFSADPGEGDGIPTIDALIVDRDTQELLWRLHPGKTMSDFANPYELIQVRPGSIRQINVSDEGMGSAHSLQVSTPMFEFATLGFLFPFMDLEAGKAFRLATYHHPSQAERHIPIYVKGRTELLGEDGTAHDVWAVDVGSTTGETVVTYYVTKDAPYFYGWHYQQVEDGASLFKMTYRGWMPTGVGR